MNKKTQGKKNKAAGQRFELKVRHDLEAKGWIVSKWMNNVEFGGSKTIKDKEKFIGVDYAKDCGKMIPSKHKFCGVGRPMAIGTGFPDFITFKEFCRDQSGTDATIVYYEIMGVEAKSNGYLDKKEKEKCKWLLDNKKFSKILIASKGTKRGQIVYKEFEPKFLQKYKADFIESKGGVKNG